jgi:biopolymer transport protein ExbD
MKLSTNQRVHYDSGPNMTPLVDVVMVILIFLMLAGSFVGAEHYLQSKQVVMSSTKEIGTLSALQNEPIEVALMSPSEDRYTARIGGVILTDRASLAGRLKSLHEQLRETAVAGEELKLVIRPDTGVKYRFLIEAYEAAVEAKFESVGFGTSPN